MLTPGLSSVLSDKKVKILTRIADKRNMAVCDMQSLLRHASCTRTILPAEGMPFALEREVEICPCIAVIDRPAQKRASRS